MTTILDLVRAADRFTQLAEAAGEALRAPTGDGSLSTHPDPRVREIWGLLVAMGMPDRAALDGLCVGLSEAAADLTRRAGLTSTQVRGWADGWIEDAELAGLAAKEPASARR